MRWAAYAIPESTGLAFPNIPISGTHGADVWWTRANEKTPDRRAAQLKKIDMFSHIHVPRLWERVNEAISSPERAERIGGYEFLREMHPELHDLDLRFREMDKHGDYRQVVTLPCPPIEDLAPPPIAIELAKIANEDLAELVGKYPDRFVGFAAALPLSDVEASLAEMDHAIDDLGALGVQMYTNVKDKPLTHPDLEPIFQKLDERGCPLWIHPDRNYTWSDYKSEPSSRYEIFWSLGWPYETATCVARLVYEGYFERFRNLHIISHHGAGGIPFFSERLAFEPILEDRADVGNARQTHPLDYFRRVYADTAMFGARHAVRCVIDFFAQDHVVFGTDWPFGEHFIRETIRNIEELDLPDSQAEAVFHGNAERLLKLIPAGVD